MNPKMRLFLWKIKSQPYVSIALVAINLLIYILCYIFPQIYVKGGCGVYEVLLNKEYGRIFWYMFLHSGATHIFNNMLIVIFMGSMLEQEIGHMAYAVNYFISGIGAGIISLLVKYMNNDWAVSVGASGAVFGLNGLLIAMVLMLRERINFSLPRVIFVVFLSLYSGFSGMNIDNAAHVGGLVIGFFVGMITCVMIRIKEK